MAQPWPLLRCRRKFIPSKSSLWSQVAIAVGCIAAIVGVMRLSRPFSGNREPIGAQLIQHPYVDSTELRAPWMHRSAEFALKTPRFLLDRELFAMDLLRTGHVSVKRAWALADVAVREAYTRRIPPALVLGVMLTENDELKSSAKSRVGAIGLMQVYPKHWASTLGRKLGTNIRADSTNLKYGIFILGWVTGRAVDRGGDRDEVWRTALLGYNGCVKGTNTPNCASYPDVVRRQVQESAKSSCRGADFDSCVVEPMWVGRRDMEHIEPASSAVVSTGSQSR